MGMTQGLLATMITDLSPRDLRGTAFGFFNLLSGFMMLVASMLAGFLWEYFNPAISFYTGIGFCLLALISLTIRHRFINDKSLQS
ncbi:MFS transporter [Legionella sp. km772]|uniref:MFS transporter n=1 Tax=Legionella sp. km772 TaxID=2498111 RepID=UPI001F32E7CE|nr:MFS transporter [Legionella sp. km772]